MAVVLLREMKLNVEEELGKRALSMHLFSFFFPFSFYFESLGVYRCSAKVKHIEWETAEASLLD